MSSAILTEFCFYYLPKAFRFCLLHKQSMFNRNRMQAHLQKWLPPCWFI